MAGPCPPGRRPAGDAGDGEAGAGDGDAAAVVAVMLGDGLRWRLTAAEVAPRYGLALAGTGAGGALTASGCAAALPAISPARPGSLMTRTMAPATASRVTSTLTASDEPRGPRAVIAPPSCPAAGLRAGPCISGSC